MFNFIKKHLVSKSYSDPDVCGVGETVKTNSLSLEQYQQFYFAEENLSAAIDAIVRAVISSGYRLKSRDENNENAERNIQIGKQLMMNMNDEDTIVDIVTDILYDMLIFGNGFLEERKASKAIVDFYFKKVANKNVPVQELPKIPIRYYRQPARYMKENWSDVVGKAKFLGYKREIKSDKKEFDKKDIILFSYLYKDGILPSPPSESIKNSAAASLKLTEYNGDFFANNATPRLHIELGNVTKEVHEKFSKKFEEQLKGKPHRNIITKGGVVIKPINLSNKEMEFKALDDTMQQKILAKYGVMPGLVGKNMVGLSKQFFVFKIMTITPIQKIIDNRINKRIFYGTFNSLNLEYESIPMDTVDKKDLSDVNEKYLKNQVFTINEVRKSMGLGSVDWGDRPIIPFSDASLAPLPDGAGGKSGEVDDGEEVEEIEDE